MHDDLLTPTLTAADDALGFGRPWNPNGVTLASFFGGPLTAAGLFAINARRLGLPRQVVPILVSFGLLAVLHIAVIIKAKQGELAVDDRSIRLGSSLVTVVAALGIARLQGHRFRLFVRSGGDLAPLFRIGILAVVLGIVAHASLTALFLGLMS